MRGHTQLSYGTFRHGLLSLVIYFGTYLQPLQRGLFTVQRSNFSELKIRLMFDLQQLEQPVLIHLHAVYSNHKIALYLTVEEPRMRP